MKSLRILVVMGIFVFVGNLQAQIVGGAVATGVASSYSPSGGPKGVPFSADVVEESTRKLSDGTLIQQETHGKSFRDSEGRTRNESEIVTPAGNGERLQHIMILDPVQHLYINLDPKNKTATIRQLPGSPAPAAPMPAASTKTTKPAAMAAKSVNEQLGTTEIEGFSATGSKYTRTIETGKIGNDKPLVTVTETWFSPDLIVVLRTKTDDPQYGQRTRNLINIRTGEPDPVLFQIPEGYTVNDTRTKN
jgi:hypothetical protein